MDQIRAIRPDLSEEYVRIFSLEPPTNELLSYLYRSFDEKDPRQLYLNSPLFRHSRLDEATNTDTLLQRTTTVKGIFRCSNCKKDETIYYSKQIRRSDEPMTVFITCVSCRHHWTEC